MKLGKFGIAFQTNKSASDYIQLARLVDQYDFDVVSVYCDAPFQPSYGPLIIMAPYIHRAMIGPAAISPFRMHPIDIAANTALLATLTRGGVYVGLARGAWLAEHGIQEPLLPLSGIREAAEIILKLLSGRDAGMEGKVFQLRQHVYAPYPLPEYKIPLLIGTWGKKLAMLAGEIADEVKIGGSSNPEMAEYLLQNIRKGESKAGRIIGEVSLAMGAVTVVDEDQKLARQIARMEVALYLPVVAALDPTVSIDPELIHRIGLKVWEKDKQAAAGLISDDLLNKFAFSGDPHDIIQQVEAVFSAGVTRVEFGTPHGALQADGIRLLGEKVIPNIKVN